MLKFKKPANGQFEAKTDNYLIKVFKDKLCFWVAEIYNAKSELIASTVARTSINARGRASYFVENGNF